MSGTSYQYVVVRCVPRVDREEFLNVGVVLHAQTADFLGAAWQVDEARLAALAPDLDPEQVRGGLSWIDAVCRADPALGGVARQPLGTRFGFLRAPRSTVLQPGPVHGGVTAREPEQELHRLVTRLVLLDR
jgi:hypothetical protein